MKKNKRVAILGAHDNPTRFAYKAMKLLEQHGYECVLVNPRFKQIETRICFETLGQITGPVDTLTLYVNAEISTRQSEDILKLRARRVIFNPGTENPELARQLSALGTECIEDCTLVMLNSGSF